MKGLIFTSFIDLVEEKFGLEVTDELLSEVETKTNGAYSNVGTYDHQELVAMVVWLSKKINVPVTELLKLFGFTLFNKLMTHHVGMVKNIKTPFEMFELIDPFIHKEVKKLYPEAETPKFNSNRISPNELVLTYYSTRKMGDVAEGLIEGCFVYFDVKGEIKREFLTPDETTVKFNIKMIPDES